MTERIEPRSRGSKVVARKVRIEEMECLPGVDEHLALGWPLTKVAAWIKRQGCGDGFSESTLVTALEAYRKTLPPSKIAAHALPSLHQEAVEKVGHGLDVLEELQKLYEIQRDRIDIDYTIETNLRKLFKTTHREIQEAREILVAYAQTQMDFGLTTRHLGTVEVTSSPLQVDDATVTAVMDDPKSRQKVLSIYDRIAALSERIAESDAEALTDLDSPPDTGADQ